MSDSGDVKSPVEAAGTQGTGHLSEKKQDVLSTPDQKKPTAVLEVSLVAEPSTQPDNLDVSPLSRTPKGPGRLQGPGSGESNLVFEYKEGMEVEANFGGIGEWYSAIIRGEKDDGTFDVEYDYGDIETQVPPDRLRPLGFHAAQYGLGGEMELSARSSYSNFTKMSPIQGITNPMAYYAFNENDTVASIDELGSLGEGSHITYSPRQDIVIDPVVPILHHRVPSLILQTDGNDPIMRGISQVQFVVESEDEFVVGDRVEANYFNKGRWYKGSISRVRIGPEKSYDVSYDDGEIEVRIESHRLRRLDESTGQKVEDASPSKALPVEEQPSLTVEVTMVRSSKGVEDDQKVRPKSGEDNLHLSEETDASAQIESKSIKDVTASSSAAELIELPSTSADNLATDSITEAKEPTTLVEDVQLNAKTEGPGTEAIDTFSSTANVAPSQSTKSVVESAGVTASSTDADAISSLPKDPSTDPQEDVKPEEPASIESSRSARAAVEPSQSTKSVVEVTEDTGVIVDSMAVTSQAEEPAVVARENVRLGESEPTENSQATEAAVEPTQSTKSIAQPDATSAISSAGDVAEIPTASEALSVAAETVVTHADATAVPSIETEATATSDPQADTQVEESREISEKMPASAAPDPAPAENPVVEPLGQVDESAGEDVGSVKNATITVDPIASIVSKPDDSTAQLNEEIVVSANPVDSSEKAVENTEPSVEITSPDSEPSGSNDTSGHMEDINNNDREVAHSEANAGSTKQNVSEAESGPSQSIKVVVPSESSDNNHLHQSNESADTSLREAAILEVKNKVEELIKESTEAAVTAVAPEPAESIKSGGETISSELLVDSTGLVESTSPVTSAKVTPDAMPPTAEVVDGDAGIECAVIDSSGVSEPNVQAVSSPSVLKEEVVVSSKEGASIENVADTDADGVDLPREFEKVSSEEADNVQSSAPPSENSAQRDVESSHDAIRPEVTTSVPLLIGARIEANYRGRGKWYKGKVLRVRNDAAVTYDIDYDDGEIEVRVEAGCVRVLEEASLTEPVSSVETARVSEPVAADETSPVSQPEPVIETAALSEAEAVAESAPVSEPEPAVEIVSASQQTKKPTVAEEATKRDDSHPAQSAEATAVPGGDTLNQVTGSAALSVGTRVEANYRGRGKWYKGKVQRVRESDHGSDVSYDIDYDDGEIEVRVEEGCVRVLLETTVVPEPEPEPAREPDVSESTMEVSKDRETLSPAEPSVEARESHSIAADSARISTVSHVLLEGTRVEANYRGRGKWYKGKVLRVRNDAVVTYDIDYDDGEIEVRVEAGCVRVLEEASLTEPVSSVETARVSEPVAADETSPVSQPEPVIETAALSEAEAVAESVTVTEPVATIETAPVSEPEPEPEPVPSAQAAEPIEEGAAVTTSEIGVKEESISEIIHDKPPTPSTAGLGSLALSEGTRVEANYRGRGKWYKGKIQRVRGAENGSDATYDIGYDDGEIEVRVEVDCVRVLDTAEVSKPAILREQPSQSPSVSIATDAVEGATENEKSAVESSHVHTDAATEVAETNSLESTSGKGSSKNAASSSETHVATHSDHGIESFIGHTLADAVVDVATNTHKHLDEALKRDSRPSSAVARESESSKTESVTAEDPISKTIEGEAVVEIPEHTEAVAVEGKPQAGSSNEGLLSQGAKVEANYRGRGKFYPGHISNVHDDGTFEVSYDDGETERQVLAENIRLLAGSVVEPATSAGSISAYALGTKVEANYRSRGKFYPGLISKVHEDGAYDVLYDDGDGEIKVKSTHIRLLESDVAVAEPTSSNVIEPENDNVTASSAAAALNDGGKYSIGTKVDANFQGHGKYYPARIRKVHDNGSYDVLYEDGEVEEDVSPERLRDFVGHSVAAPVALASASTGGAFSEGAKVETNYRGRGKFYPGRIRRNRGDGTYDIDYDDGEVEIRVLEHLIRSLEPAKPADESTVELPTEAAVPEVAGNNGDSIESFIGHTLADAVDDVATNTHKHRDEALKRDSRPSSAVASGEGVRAELSSAVIGPADAPPADDAESSSLKIASSSVSAESTSQKDPRIIEQEVSSDIVEEEPKTVESDVPDKGANANDADVFVEPTQQTTSESPTESSSSSPTTDAAVPQVSLAAVAANVVSTGGSADSERVNAGRDDREEEKEVEPVAVVYNGPAISQRKALRELQSAQATQRETLGSALQRVAELKAQLQARQIHLNHAARKAKNFLADIGDHLKTATAGVNSTVPPAEE